MEIDINKSFFLNTHLEIKLHESFRKFFCFSEFLNNLVHTILFRFFTIHNEFFVWMIFIQSLQRLLVNLIIFTHIVERG